MIRLVPTCLAFAATCGLTAQDRDLVAGRVLTRDGVPWTGAKVVLAALPMAAAPELGEIDRVEVTASRSGIFRARVLPELSYVAWGATRSDDGLLRITELVRDVRPGATVELIEDEPLRSEGLVIRGLDAWGDHGPFTVAVHSPTAELGVAVLELDADGAAPLPAWPRTTLLAEIRGADGQPLHLARPGDPGDPGETGEPPGDAAAKSTPVEFRIPPPHPLPVVVRDAAGNPLEGARIRHVVGWNGTHEWPGSAFGNLSRRIWRDGPRTDATGRATIEIPTASDPLDPKTRGRSDQMFLEATRDGFARSHSGVHDGRLFLDGQQVEAEAARTALSFTLTEPRPIRGKLERESGVPLAGHPVLLTLTSKVSSRNGWRLVPRRFLVTTDTDGAFTLADPPPDSYDACFHFLLPAEQHRTWAVDAARLLGRTGMMAAPLDAAQGSFPTVTLSSFRDVRIVTGNGATGPQPRRTVVVIPVGAQERSAVPSVPWLATTDMFGRVALRLPPGHYGFLNLDATSFVAAEFDVDRAPTPLELVLPARDYAWMRLNVETADGPAASGHVSIHWISWTERVGHQPVPLEDALKDLADDIVESARIENGRVDVPFFPHLPMLEIDIVASLWDGRESPQIRLASTTERVTVRIE